MFNQITVNSIINDKFCSFPIKNFHISRSFKYPKNLGRKIFNYNSFCKNFSSVSTYTCHCNDPKCKLFIDNDHGHIIKVIKKSLLIRIYESW